MCPVFSTIVNSSKLSFGAIANFTKPDFPEDQEIFSGLALYYQNKTAIALSSPNS